MKIKLGIRGKLVLAISILMIVVFVLAAYLFINEKKNEMADDIYFNSLAFSKLTAQKIVDNYDLYLVQNSFVYFNREMQGIFSQNEDVSDIKVLSWMGEVLYDSSKDIDQRYEGEIREISDSILLNQLRSQNISLRTLDGEVFYLKENIDGDYDFVDRNENKISSFETGTLFDYILVPVSEKYAVLYSLHYDNLQIRVARVMERVIYLALFAVFLGVLLSVFMSSHVTKPVQDLVFGAKEIAKGNFKTQVNIKTGDELEFLGLAFNEMAKNLEIGMKARFYKERVSHELELASKIQQQIIPKKIPSIEGLDISAGLLSAEEIGGDIYDFLLLNDKKLLMYLGDVTGHGVPAGIVSSIASSLFYGYSVNDNLKEILLNVNRVMKAKTMPTMFMTLCLTSWDVDKKEFKYISAGHEQIIHYKANNREVELKPAGGIALGMIPDIDKHIQEQIINLEKDDVLIIYSDGIPEAWKTEKEKYGMDRFLALVKEKASNIQSAEKLKEIILKDVRDFAQGHKQMDDVTLIVVRKV